MTDDRDTRSASWRRAFPQWLHGAAIGQVKYHNKSLGRHHASTGGLQIAGAGLSQAAILPLTLVTALAMAMLLAKSS
jgi:hypothetical protein